MLISSCETGDGPLDATAGEPGIREIQVDPASVIFEPEDGIRDTVVTFRISAEADLPDGHILVAHLVDLQDFRILDTDTLRSYVIGRSFTPNPSYTSDDFTSGDFTSDGFSSDGLTSGDFPSDGFSPGGFTSDRVSSSGLAYIGTLQTMLRTTDMRNLILYVTPVSPDRRAGNRSETVIPVRGTPSGEPLVLSVDHPDTIFLPPAGMSTTFYIAAKASHTISTDFLDQVLLELFDINSVSIYGPLPMSEEDQAYGNVPGDSIYVQGFRLESSSNPGSFTAEVHAKDVAGNVSDTLRSHFVIAPCDPIL